MIIDLTKPQNLPNQFVNRLNAIDDLCQKHKFSETLLKISDVYILVKEIDAYCHENEIVGIHYTRASPDSIKKWGLLIRSGDEIRSKFLEEHGNRFTPEEITLIKERWEIYFSGIQNSARDNKIFFNFTELALGNGGAKYLTGLYGGEQVAMCFELDDPIGIKLGKIGESIIVRCALKPSNIETFTEYPWGQILVSSYHLSKNSGAYGIDQDGFQNVAVTPEKIIEIKVL